MGQRRMIGIAPVVAASDHALALFFVMKHDHAADRHLPDRQRLLRLCERLLHVFLIGRHTVSPKNRSFAYPCRV